MSKDRGIWRGKRLDNGEWIEGYLIRDDYQAWIVPGNTPFVYYQVDPETLGECTCMHDWNRKTIFEGDICTIEDKIGIVMYNEEDAIFFVEFDFYIMVFYNDAHGSDFEVIGNIHDNPELLTK